MENDIEEIIYCSYCHGEINVGKEPFVVDVDGNKYHYDCYCQSKVYIDTDFMNEDDI